MLWIGGLSFTGVTGVSYGAGKPQAIQSPDARLALMNGWVQNPDASDAPPTPWDPDEHPDQFTLWCANLATRVGVLEAQLEAVKKAVLKPAPEPLQFRPKPLPFRRPK